MPAKTVASRRRARYEVGVDESKPRASRGQLMGGRMMPASVSHRPVGVSGVGHGASKEACSGSNGWADGMGGLEKGVKEPEAQTPCARPSQ